MDAEQITEGEVTAAKKPKKKFVHPKKTSEERKKEKELRQLRKARIILRNLSYKATEDDLSNEFKKYGTIKECNVLKREDGKLVGCAFIQYEKVNQAAKAIHHANGKEIFGRPVILDWAVNRKRFTQHLKKQKNEIKTESLDDEISIKQESDNDETEANDENESADEKNKSENKSDDDDDGEEKFKPGSDDEDEKKPIHKRSNDVAEGCTVFIKNIPFESTRDDLFKVCRPFGPLYYAVITVDKISGHSKGTGFVKFKTKESAEMCLNSGTNFKLLDQILDPQPALSRNDVLQKKDVSKHEPRDSRNLYLAKEGTILAGTPAAEGVSQSDLAKRLRLEQSKNQSLKNLNRFVATERLTVHNIPPSYDSAKLRKVVTKACGLKPNECRIMRENKPSPGNPLGKSKGYGFLSFKTHDEALNCLRKVNNNPNVFGKNNRPIVSFSIEDKAVHNIKMKRLLRSQERNPLFKKKINANQSDDVKPSGKKLKKLNKDTRKIDKKISNNEDVAEFAGAVSEKGSQYKTRPLWKLREDNSNHNRSVKEQKKELRKRKIQKEIRMEKRQIERPKQGKRKYVDIDSSLVNKYLKRLHSNAGDDKQPKSKRSKWYKD